MVCHEVEAAHQVIGAQGQTVFERGLEAKGTSHMFDLYATWLRECLAEQSNAAEQDRELHVSIQQKLLELCQRAYAAGNTLAHSASCIQ